MNSGKSHLIFTVDSLSVKWKENVLKMVLPILVVTPQDAEADEIITAELETYIAGNQTMEEAIANMVKNLNAKIGQAEIVK